jgi:hypothetical protein
VSNLPYSAPMLLGMSLLWILRDPKEGLVYLAKWNHSGQPISELNNDYYSKMKLF